MLSAALRRASGRIARPILRNASTKIVPVEAEISMAYGIFSYKLINYIHHLDAVLVAFYAWFIAYNARRVAQRSWTPMDYEVRTDGITSDSLKCTSDYTFLLLCLGHQGYQQLFRPVPASLPLYFRINEATRTLIYSITATNLVSQLSSLLHQNQPYL